MLFLRYNLGQIVHADIDKATKLFTYRFESQPYLFPCEIEKTRLHHNFPHFVELSLRDPTQTMSPEFRFQLPLDANVLKNSIRMDHDTKLGGLTEIWIKRLKHVNHKEDLRAPRFKNFFADVWTTETLHEQPGNLAENEFELDGQ